MRVRMCTCVRACVRLFTCVFGSSLFRGRRGMGSELGRVRDEWVMVDTWEMEGREMKGQGKVRTVWYGMVRKGVHVLSCLVLSWVRKREDHGLGVVL